MAWHDCYGKQVTKGLNSYHYIAISVYLTLMATLLHHTCIALSQGGYPYPHLFLINLYMT